MFIDIYFPPGLTIDRDEIQVELERQLGSRGEVVGAGTGEAGCAERLLGEDHPGRERHQHVSLAAV